jgi:branched-chain amino acid transport system substrate-binding protein
MKLFNVKKQSGLVDSVHDKNSSQYIRQLISVAYNNYNMLFCIIIIVMFCLGGCEKNESIKIGFVGDLTGSMSELGINGRNGVFLAVEECNASGGIDGHLIKLITKDDKHDEKQALVVDQALIKEGVTAIIGHMTSTMSVKVLPLINQEKILMISPTTSKLSRIDDYFIRLIPYDQTNFYLAQYAYKKLGLKKITIVYDLSNIAFSNMVRNDFTKEFEALGGKIILSNSFTSGPELDYINMIKTLINSKPEGLLIIAGAIDTAMICQHIRMSGSQIPVMHNGWAGTKELVQHGGPAIEGIIFPIMYNKDSQEKLFIEFKNRYIKRFGRDPDFASVYAYEAALLLISALSESTDPTKLKDIILKQGSLDGLQGEITFDKYGDAQRKTSIIKINNGKILVLD